MVARTHWTADMVRDLPDDGQRYETVDGVLLVSPSPRKPHQRVLGRLYLAVGIYLAREPVGEAFFSPADVAWGPDTLVQPDLFVLDANERSNRTWSPLSRLLLAVEVLSPSSIDADRVVKRMLYQRAGVATYWVVDADERVVEVWTAGAEAKVVETRVLRWHPAGAAKALEIKLAELFAD